MGYSCYCLHESIKLAYREERELPFERLMIIALPRGLHYPLKMIQRKGKERDMLEKQPILRVKGKNGIAWYPTLVKDTNGKWKPKDESFQKMLMSQAVLEKPAGEKAKV